jgi:hypothetical protein
VVKPNKKYCPKCKILFECKVDSIEECHCADIALTEQERNYFSEKFEGCLCVKCMKELQVEYQSHQ